MFEANKKFKKHRTRIIIETWIMNKGTYSLYVNAVILHMLDIYDEKSCKKLLLNVLAYNVLQSTCSCRGC